MRVRRSGACARVAGLGFEGQRTGEGVDGVIDLRRQGEGLRDRVTGTCSGGRES